MSIVKQCILVLVVSTIFIGCSTVPDIDAIRSDLIGQKVGKWRFVSLSEFQKMAIVSVSEQGSIREYLIRMTLGDMRNGDTHQVDLLVTYKKSDGRWQLFRLFPKSWISETRES